MMLNTKYESPGPCSFRQEDRKTSKDAKKKPTKASSKDSGISEAGTKLHTGNGKASAHSDNFKTSSSSSSSQVVFEKVYMEPSYAEKKVETILSFVSSPTNKLYVLFLSYTLKVYEEILTCLQSEVPKIHLLRRSLQKLLRTLLVMFIKPSAMAQTPLDQVNYHASYNIKTRGPRGPWNAHLRVKILKSSLFHCIIYNRRHLGVYI